MDVVNVSEAGPNIKQLGPPLLLRCNAAFFGYRVNHRERVKIGYGFSVSTRRFLLIYFSQALFSLPSVFPKFPYCFCTIPLS